MARKRKRRRGSGRKQFNRKQPLQSARSWLENYEGNKVVRDYRRRYSVAWEVAFAELEMLGAPVDPVYRERVLQSVAAQAAARRRKQAEREADRESATGIESDGCSAFIMGYTSGGVPYGLTGEEWEAMEVDNWEEE